VTSHSGFCHAPPDRSCLSHQTVTPGRRLRFLRGAGIFQADIPPGSRFTSFGPGAERARYARDSAAGRAGHNWPRPVGYPQSSARRRQPLISGMTCCVSSGPYGVPHRWPSPPARGRCRPVRRDCRADAEVFHSEPLNLSGRPAAGWRDLGRVADMDDAVLRAAGNSGCGPCAGSTEPVQRGSTARPHPRDAGTAGSPPGGADIGATRPRASGGRTTVLRCPHHRPGRGPPERLRPPRPP